MNYITNDDRTTQLFHSWAGGADLIIAKYFFWNAGSPMQKSQQGLLQSLLHEIFEQQPGLVPVICPSRWERYHNFGGTWTRSELKQAFRRLSYQRLKELKFGYRVFPMILMGYFQQIFDTIDNLYREETAEALLLCLEGNQPLPLIMLWSHEQERGKPNITSYAQITPLERDDPVAIFKQMYKRVNARLQNLVMIQSNPTVPPHLKHFKYTVTFLHLTVKEFLSQPDMLGKLRRWASKDFHAKLALLKASLRIAKSLLLPTENCLEEGSEQWTEFWSVNLSQWGGCVNDFFTTPMISNRKKVLWTIDYSMSCNG